MESPPLTFDRLQLNIQATILPTCVQIQPIKYHTQTANYKHHAATWRAASNLRSQHTKLKGLYNMILSEHSTKYDAVILTFAVPPPTVTNTVV